MSSAENNQIDVVSICDPEKLIVEWRPIPGYSKYEACNLGLVRRVGCTGTGGLYKVKTSKGTYLRSSCLSDDWRVRTKEVHHLVCLAFHGPAPVSDVVYEVNHINGNKHCNYPDNLEWLTRGQNLTHAYATGLRNDNIPVQVTDHVTGETMRYYSLGAFARQFKLSPNRALAVVSQHGSKLYNDTYTFALDTSNRKTPGHWFIRELKAMDYRTGLTLLASDALTLELKTGVKRATILHNLRIGRQDLVHGYVFKYIDDDTDWPVFSSKDVELSVIEYSGKTAAADKRYGVVVRDYVLNTVTPYRTFMAASSATGVVFGTVRYLLSQSELRLFKGRVYKYAEDPREWPAYSQERIDISLVVKKPEYLPVRITDHTTNTTKLYPSVAEFARSVGVNKTAASNAFRLNPSVPYMGRWTASRVEL